MKQLPQNLIRALFILNTCAALTCAPAWSLDFDPNVSLTLLGSFKYPSGSTDQTTFAYGGDDIGFNPTNNTIRATGHDWYQRIAEITIPSNLNGMPTAAFSQQWGDATDGRLGNIGAGTNKMGGYLIDDLNGDGTYEMLSTGYIFYDANGAATASHFLSKTLSLANTSDTEGPFTPSGTGPGHVAGYMAKVPTSMQARLGTKYVTGQGCLSIISRTSYGAALFGFDPAAMVNNPSNRTFATTKFIDYPLDNGPWNFTGSFSENNAFNAVTQLTGVFFYDDPTGDSGDAVIIYGSQGVGTICYKGDKAGCADTGGYNVVGNNYDPMLWVYKVSDLVAVKNGTMQANQIRPRTVALPFSIGAWKSGGAAFDPATNRLYLAVQCSLEYCQPQINVYQMNTTPPTPTAPSINTQPVNRTVSVGATATFSVGASGNPTPTYQWQKGTTNISGATIASYTTPATVLGDSGSTYRCVITNSQGTVTSNAATLTVTPVNLAPVVNAGSDLNVTLPSEAAIDATVSDDNLPSNTLTNTWSKVSGPGTVTFTFPNGGTTDASAAFSAPGTYVLRLTANDGALSTTDNITVVVNPLVVNQAPSVDAGVPQMINFPAVANLDGTVFDDGLPNPPGVLQITWSGTGVTFGNPNAADTTATFTGSGIRTLTLTVTDGLITRSDTVEINVRPTPQAPTLDPFSSIVTITLPNFANLRASIMHRASGPTTIQWTKVSGPGTVTFGAPTELETSATFSTAGSYVVRISATQEGLTGTADITVTVNPQSSTNQTPSANAGPDFQAVLGEPISIHGAYSDDGRPGGPVTITWSMQWGPSAEATAIFANPNALDTTVTFSEVGRYALDIDVNDGERTGSDSVIVSVNFVNEPPRVNAGNDLTVIAPAFASLDATITDHAPLPLNITAAWTKVSGPGAVIFGPANAIKTIASFSSLGTYVLRLTGSDGLLSASDDVTVIVTTPPTTQNQPPVANAGADIRFAELQQIHLSGTVSDDGQPAVPTAQWSKVSGPGIITFGTPNAFDTTARFSVIGKYVIQLRVSDGALSDIDEVTIDFGAATPPPPPQTPNQTQAQPLKNIMGPKDSSVEIYCDETGQAKIYSLPDGQLVWEQTCSGEKTVWFGLNKEQHKVGSGHYFYRDMNKKIRNIVVVK